MQSNSGAAARTVALAATGANDYNNTAYVGILRQNGTTMGPDRNGAWIAGSFSYATPVLSASVFDGTNAYLYTNGTQQGSYASTGNFTISSYAIAANTNTADAHYWSGFIGEVIVYSSALTTVQRQQVEGYLAWKWLGGIPPILQFTQLTSGGSKIWQQPSFSSNMQTGIALQNGSGYIWTTTDGGVSWTQRLGPYYWYDAAISADGSTMYAGQYVNPGTPGYLYKSTDGGANWTWLSNAVGTTQQGVACSSNGAIVYAANGTGVGVSSNYGATWTASPMTNNCVPVCCSLNGTIGYAGGFTGYMYVTSNTGATWTTITSGLPASSNYYFGLACSADGTKAAVTNATNSNVYVSSNTGTSWSVAASVSNLIQIRTYGLAMSSNGNTIYVIGGTSLYKSTDFGVSWTAQSGLTTASGMYSDGGGIACSRDGSNVIVATNNSSTAGYLYKGTPGSSHPFYPIKPFLRTFQPTDIGGCALWLDAIDATTLALSGSNVSQWSDKSGTANHAVQGTASNRPTYATDSGYPAVAFSGSAQYLFGTNPLLTSTSMSMFIVHRTTNTSATQYVFFDYKVIGSNYVQFVHNPGAYGGDITYATSPYTNKGFSYSSTSNRTMTSFVDSPTNTTSNFYANGSLVSTTLTSGGVSNVATDAVGYGIGVFRQNLTTAYGTYYFQGYIYEIIVYPTELTTSQRQQVEGYLAKRWNLTTVVAPFTNPTSIPGCTLWLDAQDSSTITGTSTVTQWRDKSGLACNTTAYYGSPALTSNAINGYQAISFNGSSYLSGSNSNSTTTATFFFVGTMSPSVALYGTMYSFSPPNTNAWQTTTSFNGGSQQSSGTRVITPQRNISGGPTFTPGFNTPFIFTNVFNGTNWFGYGSGITLGSQASTGNFSYTKYVVGSGEGSGGTNIPGWTGYIGELIAYNTALTDTQRQQVEYYLSTKWGLTTATSFNPTMIPNTLLWFDASDTSTLSNTGSTVNSWTSKGSFTGAASSNTGTATTGLTTLNGKNVVTIAAGAKLAFTTAAANQARTYFVVSRVTQRITYATYPFVVPGYIVLATSGTGQDSFFGPGFALGTGGEQNIFISQTGVTDRTTSGYVLSPGNGHWAVYTASSSAVAASNSYVSVHGTPITSGGGISSLASGYPTGSYTRTIGSGGTVGYDLAELIMINGEVTTTQRQQIEYYLANKWGLLTVSAFEPTIISNVLLWLDAADTSTITTSGTQVTQWRNKGTFDANVSNATGTVTSGTATFNGLNIVQLPPSTSLAITMLIPNQPRAWFAVFRQTTQLTAQNPYFNIFANFSTSGGDQLAGPEFNGTLAEFRNGIAGMVGTTSATSGFNLFRIYNWTNSAASTSLNRVAINGTALTLTDNSLASGYNTSSLVYNILSSGHGHGADLAELICINAEITVLQRQQIEYYLSQKWGIAGPVAPAYYGPSNVTFGPSAVSFAGSTTPVLPTTHPFVKIPPSTTLPFSPLQITGCCLWLDANDPAGTGTQPSAGALATWTDKSGSSNHMTAAGTTPTFSNVPPGAVTFGGAGYYSKASAVFSNFYTAFFVYKQTGGGPLYTTGASSGSNGLFPNESGTTYFTRGDSTWYSNVSSPFASNVTNLAGVSFSSNVVGSNQSLFYNGSNVVTTTQANTITYTNLLIGSRQSGGTAYFNGSIYEVIGYNGTLTTDLRQRVEGYLAQKWKV
jgi:hypothetical protein